MPKTILVGDQTIRVSTSPQVKRGLRLVLGTPGVGWARAVPPARRRPPRARPATRRFLRARWLPSRATVPTVPAGRALPECAAIRDLWPTGPSWPDGKQLTPWF
jgi:hypothetical protein